MNPEIEKLMDYAIANGVITAKDREIIRKKAEKLGEDPDEAEMVLNAKLAMQNKETAASATPLTSPSSQPTYSANKPVKPDNFLIWGILTTILCCLPLGIVSVVYASKVDGLYHNGQFDDAKKAASNAKTWAIVSASIGFVFAIIYGIAMAAAGL